MFQETSELLEKINLQLTFIIICWPMSSRGTLLIPDIKMLFDSFKNETHHFIKCA